LVCSREFVEWKRVVAIFDGTRHGVNAVKVAHAIAEQSGMPVSVHASLVQSCSERCERLLVEAGLASHVSQERIDWLLSDRPAVADTLLSIPRDALVVVASDGPSRLRDLLFGHPLRRVRRVLPNSMVAVPTILY
jgi:nucleotide-binding universal stress UspA family protein